MWTLTLLQTVVTGLLLGSLYGLFSSGLTLIFGITRVVNFAHGDFVTLAMFGAVTAAGWHISPFVALVPLAIAAFGVGWVTYKVLIRRTLTRSSASEEQTHQSQMVLTLALSIFISNALLLAFGPEPRSMSGVLTGTYRVLGIYVGESRLVAFGIAVIVFGLLSVLLSRTLYGKAIRATVDDADMATMVGINTRRVYAVAFSIGITMTAIAGVVLATYYPVTPTASQGFLITAFVTVVMGGLGSVGGAFSAGLLVGVVQQVAATYMAIDLQNVAIFVAFILVLAFRPRGLFNRKVAVR